MLVRLLRFIQSNSEGFKTALKTVTARLSSACSNSTPGKHQTLTLTFRQPFDNTAWQRETVAGIDFCRLYPRMAPYTGHSSQLVSNANCGDAQRISNDAWPRVRKSLIRPEGYEDHGIPRTSYAQTALCPAAGISSPQINLLRNLLMPGRYRWYCCLALPSLFDRLSRTT